MGWYNVCPVCFNSFDRKCQNIGGISQQPLLCSCIPPLVDDCLRDGYMPFLRDENDEHCFFLGQSLDVTTMTHHPMMLTG